MNILVLNGSPKGDYSITLQTILYLQKKFINDKFEIINVGQKIKKYEKDFSDIIAAIKKADVLLFAYPVYTFLAPYQLHRFIELLKLQKIDLSNKYAVQITTSKHFYDMTAHKYIEENCSDLGINYIYGLSADMEDLLNKKGQKEAIEFWDYIHYCIDKNIVAEIKNVKPISSFSYIPSLDETPKSDKYDTVILSNSNQDANLDNMIEDFRRAYPHKTRLINISEYPFSGGCLGCFNCAKDGKCIYKDNFDNFLREDIQKADAIIFAFTIKDHSMGSSFKIYDDRQFCNGHRAVTAGMPIGFIINGNIDEEYNLLTVLRGRSEVGHNFLSGIASDAQGLLNMSSKLDYALQNKILLPQNFLGVGGKKIFRDLIYLMRGIMRADHKFYKKTGEYDFPQKKKLYMYKMLLIGSLISNPYIKKKLGSKMNEGMIAPYKKIINKG